MNIQYISAVTLAVQDMARAVAFYQAIGLGVLYGGAQATFTSFRLGDTFLNLILAPAYIGRWWGRIIFRVEKVDDLYAALIAQGMNPEPPRDAAWGERYFHIKDPDGHELSFAESLRGGLDRHVALPTMPLPPTRLPGLTRRPLQLHPATDADRLNDLMQRRHERKVSSRGRLHTSEPGEHCEQYCSDEYSRQCAERTAPRQSSCGQRCERLELFHGERSFPHASGANRCNSSIPGRPPTMVIQKNIVQPTASTRKPLTGPDTRRGSPNRLEKSAYCVAEKRFWVRRSSNTAKAPVPMPWVRLSNPRPHT